MLYPDQEATVSVSMYAQAEDGDRVEARPLATAGRPTHLTIGGSISILLPEKKLLEVAAALNAEIERLGLLVRDDECVDEEGPEEPFSWGVVCDPSEDLRLLVQTDAKGMTMRQIQITDLEWCGAEGKIGLLLARRKLI